MSVQRLTYFPHGHNGLLELQVFPMDKAELAIHFLSSFLLKNVPLITITFLLTQEFFSNHYVSLRFHLKHYFEFVATD